jgi:Na+/proline symporter
MVLNRADYLHCIILFTCLLVLVLSTYTGGNVVSSPGHLYDLLLEASKVGFPGGISLQILETHDSIGEPSTW